MEKPEVGDVLILYPTLHDEFPSLKVNVHAVFDNLTENWDPFGEHAMGQAEVDEFSGKKGEWYAVVYNPVDEGETWPVASYEVQEVVKL